MLVTANINDQLEYLKKIFLSEEPLIMLLRAPSSLLLFTFYLMNMKIHTSNQKFICGNGWVDKTTKMV